jgi:DNA-binding NarL/FixJ family response regulator
VLVAEPITVVLADDHALVRDMLCARLRAASMDVIACAGRADGAVALVAEHRPDVLLLDIDMPGRSAFAAAREVCSISPQTRVLFLSAFVHDAYIEQALHCEASGYVTKSEPVDVVVDAIRRVASGRCHFSPEVMQRLVVASDGVRLCSDRSARLAALTERELEVLGYVAKGLQQKQLAFLMDISLKTVQTHIANLMDKLDIHDRVALARFAIREGLIEA